NELVVTALLDQYRRHLPLLPGAVVAVRRLADRWPLGLASSSNRPVIDAVLKRAGISNCFAVTVSGEEVAAGKPAPDGYFTATRRLGADPADADERPAGGRHGGNGRDRKSQPRVPTRARSAGAGGVSRRVLRRVDAGRDRVRGAANTHSDIV